MNSIYVTHAAACLYMTGVIWVIQALHYPAFALIPPESFITFHARHTRRMTYVAGPAMLLELATGAWLVWGRGGWWWLDLVAVSTLFAATFLISVPLHDRLSRGADPKLAARLTLTNWPRTAVWTVRSLVFICFSYDGMWT